MPKKSYNSNSWKQIPWEDLHGQFVDGRFVYYDFIEDEDGEWLLDQKYSFRFTEVLLSSSIIPHLIVFGLIFKTFSTLLKSSLVKLHSSGPCILGLTIYIEPVLEFFFNLRSCIEHIEVINSSIIP